MRLAHPSTELAPAANPRLTLAHPLLEVAGTHPARIHLAEQADELPRLGLLRERRGFWVRGGHGVEERPGRAAQLLDVGRTVGGW